MGEESRVVTELAAKLLKALSIQRSKDPRSLNITEPLGLDLSFESLNMLLNFLGTRMYVHALLCHVLDIKAKGAIIISLASLDVRVLVICLRPGSGGSLAHRR